MERNRKDRNGGVLARCGDKLFYCVYIICKGLAFGFGIILIAQYSVFYNSRAYLYFTRKVKRSNRIAYFRAVYFLAV